MKTSPKSPTTRREAAAEALRAEIVASAAKLFDEQGFQKTSINAIAAEADVAVQTIYNSIGSKSDVLLAVLDHAVAGPLAPQPVPQLMRERAAAAEHPREIIEQLVQFWAGGALRRAIPVMRVIEQAAAVDPRMRKFADERAAKRLSNYGQPAKMLADRGALRDGVSIREAAATIFAVGHPDMFDLLVNRGGWTVTAWSRWAEETICTALLR